MKIANPQVEFCLKFSICFLWKWKAEDFALSFFFHTITFGREHFSGLPKGQISLPYPTWQHYTSLPASNQMNFAFRFLGLENLKAERCFRDWLLSFAEVFPGNLTPLVLCIVD